MKKHNRLPVDGYVIDHNTQDCSNVYQCSYCGKDTTNYSRDYFTKEMDTEHYCDNCTLERYPNIDW